jgi:hypothetical protein
MTPDKQPYVESWKVRGIREAHAQRAEADTALSEAEAEELSKCEEVIERDLKGFIRVGMALLAVRDKRLYRGAYPTFEAYAHQRWGLSRQHAYRMIDAAEITSALSPIGDIPLPASEAQARELRGLKPEVAAEVMTRAVELAGSKKNLTAAVIRKVRRRVVPRPPHIKPPPKPKPIPNREIDRRNVERLYDYRVANLRQSAPDLLAAFKGGTFEAVTRDAVEEWDLAWAAWKWRAQLADGLHKITSLAEDPEVLLDWVLHAPLAEAQKNLSPEGIATAIQFLLKAESHGLTPEMFEEPEAEKEQDSYPFRITEVQAYLSMIESKFIWIRLTRDDQGVQEARQFANALRDLTAAVEEWAEGEA